VPAEYDEIGIWSEVKLAIIKDYASAYFVSVLCRIMQSYVGLRHHANAHAVLDRPGSHT
jgi:hypothetical protein